MRKSAISAEKWEEMRERYLKGEKYCDIAEDYGIDRTTVEKHAQKCGWIEERRAIRAKAKAESDLRVSASYVRQGDRASVIADELLDVIQSGVADASLYQCAGDVQKLASALVSLRSMVGDVARRNAEEQTARIEKLRADTVATVDAPKQIKITFDSGMEDYAK